MAASRPKQPIGRLAAGVIVGGLALWYAVGDVELAALRRSLVNASPGWVGMAISGVLAVALLKTGRWQQLYRLSRINVPFGPLFSTLMASQMINLLIPIRVGELVRLGLMKRRGQPVGATLPTLLIEKALDLLAGGLLLVSLTLLPTGPSGLGQTAGGLVVISLVLLFGSALLWQQRARIEALVTTPAGRSRWSTVIEPWLPFLQRFLSGLGLLAGWRALGLLVCWTSAIWLSSLLTILALLAAFNLAVPPAAAVLIMVGISFSNIAPSPPALIGLMPGIAVAALSLYGVPPADGLAFGLVLNVVTVAPLVGLGSWAVWGEVEAVAALIRQPGR